MRSISTRSKPGIARGENPCVLVDGREYVLFYAPANGVGVNRSADLKEWREDGPPITLGQRDCPWAETRLTAGYVADLRQVPGVGRYVLVCHSIGPGEIQDRRQHQRRLQHRHRLERRLEDVAVAAVNVSRRGRSHVKKFAIMCPETAQSVVRECPPTLAPRS
jgi:hypothetical protein